MFFVSISDGNNVAHTFLTFAPFDIQLREVCQDKIRKLYNIIKIKQKQRTNRKKIRKHCKYTDYK